MSFLSDILWGTPMLVLLLGTGLYLTVRSRFFQFRECRRIFRSTIGEVIGKNRSARQVRSVCTALGVTMGPGNIVGVATAIHLGGAGSVFWMWVSALLGMMIVFTENRLAVRYSDRGAGPMGYLPRRLAVVYAVACVLASFGMGNMVQSASLTAGVTSVLDIPPVIVGGATAFLVGAVIIGGAENIGRVAEKVLPFVSALYILVSILLIVCNIEALAEAFSSIFRYAFTPSSVGGGAVGYTVSRAVSAGLRRGVFSNEAGLGSASVLHSDCEGEEKQGMWGIAEVFIDTIVCCTLTALVILVVFPQSENCKGYQLDGTELVSAAFSSLLGKYSGVFVAFCLVLFAFATLIGWSAIGEKAWVFLTKGRFSIYYKYIYVIFILIGAVISADEVWFLSDIFNAAMAIPNLAGILAVSQQGRGGEPPLASVTHG